MKKHSDRLIQIGLNIAFYRKLKGLTQQQLAEAANISRTYMSKIEAPNMDISLSSETLFSIADALGVEPYKLFEFRKDR